MPGAGARCSFPATVRRTKHFSVNDGFTDAIEQLGFCHVFAMRRISALRKLILSPSINHTWLWWRDVEKGLKVITTLTKTKAFLLGGAALIVASATPALAQSQAAADEPAKTTAADDTPSDIVVTGTLFKGGKTISPVTIVSAEDLDKRGISTTQDAIQQLTSNNGPALTNSFTANGAFAAGASAVSLRGLSTNSTLVLFDGLRAAYYPLADDGSRNFVDLNTIPDDIVDRIEVVRDGASSLYGADAIAGVVNIITKKSFKGLSARAESGIAEGGYGAQYRLSATAGFGDLDEKGFNAYVSGFWYKSNQVKNSQLPAPFNTDNHNNLVYGGIPGSNGVANGVDADGNFLGLSTASSFTVRPYDATNTTAQGPWQLLNPNCNVGTPYTLTAADRAANPTSPGTVCQADYTNLYGVVQPNIERFGVSGRATARINDATEAFVEFNFVQNTANYTGFPASVFGNAPTGIFFPQFSTSSNAANRAQGSLILNLPVYVCPERVNCSTSANRTLNPNNPFAAQGQVARLIGRDLESVTENQTRNRVYRLAAGVKGNVTDNITYNVAGTASHTDLERRSDGYVYIQHLLDLVADGTYNFINPSQNSQTVLNYLKPENIVNATSDLYQITGSLNGSFLELPGGKIQVGIGGSIHYEAVNAPSGNSDFNGPTQRYFTLNAFGTKGSRTVYSAFGEVKAPILDNLEVDASGRYDSYSSGQSAFSPKVGAVYTPIRQLTIHGSWSRGFRIPSFGEANALPTTGYVTNNVSLFNDAYLAQYGCSTATFNSCPTYIRSGSYGQTTLASPNLQPEKSRSFTVGAEFSPIRNIQFTVDYYNIRKTGVITQPSNAPALLAYYNGQPIPAGYNVIADAPDTNNPNATPRVAFVESQLINANSYLTDGIDFSASGQFTVRGVKWRSSVDATVILRLKQQFPDGTVERYDGTLGNFNLTAGSGTPKWRGTWLNSFDFGKVVVTGTANLFGGYDLSAQDQGTGYKDCGLSPYGTSYCRVPTYITFDLNTQFKVTDKFTFYVTALNLFDNLPGIDPVTYGANYYNPVQGGNGILGRYWKAGVTAKF